MGKIGVECYRRSCKQYFISGVEECESCINDSNYEKEKSGNLPEANRNAVLADVLELVQVSDEIIELLHDRFANGYSGYRAFEKLKERADKVKRAHFS